MSKTTTQQGMTFRYVDAGTVEIGDNVRHTVDLDDEFLASIKDNGVLQAVALVEDEQGTLTVRFGQRRTLAAAKVGVPLPATIYKADSDEARRIIEQLAENDHRAHVVNGDRVTAYEQLAGFGLTAEQIASRTGRAADEVTAALRASRSDLAKKAADRYEFLTIEQAATLAEFDDNDEDVTALVASASTGQFAHVAQQIRDRRETEAQIAQAEAKLESKGVRIITEGDTAALDGWARLDRLSNKKGGHAYNKTTHRNCPGHVAYVTVQHRYGRSETGDWTRLAEVVTIYGCTSWAESGHVDLTAREEHGGKKRAADMSDEEREQARAERRDVIESNKAWDTAEPVRREWLATFAARKSAPKGAAEFIARVVTEHPETVSDVAGDRLAAAWLSLDAPAYGWTRGWDKVTGKATDARRTVVTIARLLAGIEGRMSRETWKHATAAQVLMLTTISEWGYPLSPIEKRASGIK